MKIKLTRWHQPLTSTYESECGCIQLKCRRIRGSCDGLFDHTYIVFKSPKWICSIELGGFKRRGPYRNSSNRAKQDATKLIRELLLDIQNGTKQLMKQHCVTEEEVN